MKKNVIVTGGAQGIGKTIVLDLLKNGYAVTVLEIDKEAIEELKEELPEETVSMFCVNVMNEEEVREAVTTAAKIHENIYGLINNAAIANNKPVTKLRLEEWDQIIGTNLTGAFLCVKHVIPFMKGTEGRIVNIASTRALQSEPNTEAYSASKGGIMALTHSLAASLGPKIKVNSISPGWIDVSAIKKKATSKQCKLSREDHFQHPAGRVGKASDIANMVLFLLQTENDFITGQNFVIDGGMTTKMIYV